MATEKTDTTQDGTEVKAPTPANEPKAKSAAKPKAKSAAKPKAQKPAKTDGATMLKAVGREACRLHKLAQVWVTDDGQCFPLMGDAKAHAANLNNKEIIKVTAE